MQKISVIVPCLNMEKYIKNCLTSIMAQTLKELEILVVDAGSTDGTRYILTELAKEDDRICVIHSRKRSYGYQVNIGLEHAKGEYIAFVDADDRIAPTMYERLYEQAVQSDADYVKGSARSFYTISESFTYYKPIMHFPREEYRDGSIRLEPANRPDLLTKDCFIWSGIYKRGFMEHIRLHESPGAAFQDLGCLLQTQMKAQSAVYLEEYFYEYRQDNTSASGYHPRGFQFVWEEYAWAEQLIECAEVGWKKAFYRKLFGHMMDRYYAMGASENYWDNAAQYIQLIREKMKVAYVEKVITDADLTEEERGWLYLFFSDSFKVYEKCLDTYRARKKKLADIAKMARGRETVIFGCGDYGKFLYALFLKYGVCDTLAYCDNKQEMWGQFVWDIPVLQPSEAVTLYPDACFIIANRKHHHQMSCQLAELGIQERNICFYTAGIDMRLFGEKEL